MSGIREKGRGRGVRCGSREAGESSEVWLSIQGWKGQGAKNSLVKVGG